MSEITAAPREAGLSGLTCAPLTAELVAHRRAGSKPPIEPAPYRPDRF